MVSSGVKLWYRDIAILSSSPSTSKIKKIKNKTKWFWFDEWVSHVKQSPLWACILLAQIKIKCVSL